MSAPTVADPGNHVYARILTYRGVISTGDPWDVTGGGVKATASTSVTVTGVTTTLTNTLIVQAVAQDIDAAATAFSAQANANLTSVLERSDFGTASGNGGGVGVWDGVKATAGATGDSTATVTSSINAFLTIALKREPPPELSFSFRKSITIDRTKVPSSCGATMADFPMLYSVTDASLKTTAYGGHVTDANGNDILFRALDDATCGGGAGSSPCTLDHEIESYNGTTGQLVAWVRIPSLNTAAASSNTVIYIYYGNSGITSSIQNADGVWDANYVGVWHLKEEAAGTGTVGLYVDSSGNANHGTDLISATGQTGQVNGGHDFDGVDDRVNALSGASLDDLGPLTFSCWIRPDTFGSVNSVQLIVKSTTGSDAGTVRIELDNTAPEVAAFAFFKDHATTDLDVNSANSTITLGAWNHLTATWDGSVNASGVRLYRSGSETLYGAATSGAGAKVSDATLNMHIGAYGGGTGATDGLLDEVRISNIVRSSCWIGAEFNNMNAPGDVGVPNFYTVGSEESSPLTAVELIAFTATRYDRGVLAQWRTGYEIDNLGFHVYREIDGQKTRVNGSLIAGSGLMAGRGTAVTAEHRYGLWDLDGAALSASVAYWLEDLDFNGKSTWHGPVTPVAGGPALPDVAPSAELHELSKRTKAWKVFVTHGEAGERRGRPAWGATPQSPIDTQWTLAGQAAVKMGIRAAGWYRVAQADLVAAGLDPRVDPRTLHLFVDGVEQALRVTGEADGRFDPADAIEFYGTGVDTPYTDTRVYWLTAGGPRGQRIGVTGSAGAIAGAAATRGAASFWATLQRKDRAIYFAALRNGDTENWFGPLVWADPTDLTLTVTNIDRAAPAPARLEVALQGVTDLPDVSPDHRVGVLVNGTDIGELTFDGQAHQVQSFAVPVEVLREGENTVTLLARGGDADYSLVDVLGLSYWHTYRADADRLRATVDVPGPVTIGGFASRAIRVVDITDPAAAVELGGAVRAEGGGFSSVTVPVPGPGPRTLLAFTEATIASPALVQANQPSSWHATTQAHNYVAIAHPTFVEQVKPLAALREQQGHLAAVITVDDVYDEFSFGEKTPQALKDFLQYARTNWREPPRFVVLVGDATIDPRDYAGFGDADFVPTKQVAMALVALETASDDWFVDFDDDGLPDLAIGRLSVRTAEQAATVVAKTVGYEQAGAQPWTKDVLLVADQDDGMATFQAYSARLIAHLPADYTGHQLFRGALDAETARRALSDRVNDGQLIVNYQGHGSVHIWGDLLTQDDVTTSWQNATRLPFVVAMNCLNGFFHGIWDEESLAETLQRAPGGGAIAAWSSSSVTEAATQALVNEELFRLIFRGAYATVGEAVAAAKRVVANRDVRRSWIFFGDPAMRLSGTPLPASSQTKPSPTPATVTSSATSNREAPADADAATPSGTGGAPVRLADFDGDGRADLLVNRADSGEWQILTAAGRLFRAGQWSLGLQVRAANFNRDPLADLFLYEPLSGAWFQLLNTGGTFLETPGTALSDADVHFGDLDGDGDDDVLLYQPATGNWARGVSDGQGPLTFTSGRGAAELTIRVADFDGDGLADTFTYQRASGIWRLTLSRSKGSAPSVEGTAPPNREPVVANLDGDRRADLLFYAPTTGRWETWGSRGPGGFQVATGTWSPGLVVHIADFTGDGRDEALLYEPPTGAWAVTPLTAAASALQALGFAPARATLASGDVDGDGSAEAYVYQPQTGRVLFLNPEPAGTLQVMSTTWPTGWTLVGREP